MNYLKVLGIGSRQRTWLCVATLLMNLGLSGSAAPPPVEIVLYVAQHPDADDRNTGTAESPLLTLGEALDRAVENRLAGEATTILIGAGTYRESLVRAFNSLSGPRIAFIADGSGDVVVTGADVWSDWQCESAICTSDWPYDWGVAHNPWPERVEVHPLARRREVVLIDEKSLEQVETAAELREGTFVVDEGADTIAVFPPAGVDLATSTVEVGVRGNLVRLQGLHNLRFEGITFTGAASDFRAAAVDVVDQRDVSLVNVNVQGNGQVGVALKGHHLEIVNANLSDNGSSGITAYQVEGARIVATHIEGNNWRGHRYGYDSWEVGNKFSSVHDIRIDAITSVGNFSRGLWFDLDIVNVHITNSVICDNSRDGVFFEASRGPIRLENSTICNNGEYGILTSTSQYLEIVDNDVRGNAYAQLGVSGDLQRTVRDWSTGAESEITSRSWLVLQNEFQARGSQMLVDTTLPNEIWESLMRTSIFAGNSYSHLDSAQPFEVPGGRTVDFDTWSELAGEDGSSEFEGPAR